MSGCIFAWVRNDICQQWAHIQHIWAKPLYNWWSCQWRTDHPPRQQSLCSRLQTKIFAMITCCNITLNYLLKYLYQCSPWYPLKLQQDNVKYSNLQALHESDPTSKRLSRPKKSPIRKFSPMSVQPRNTFSVAMFSEDWLVNQMFVQENSEQNSFHLWRPPWSSRCYCMKTIILIMVMMMMTRWWWW